MYWFLWPLCLVWMLVCCLYKEVYLQILKCVSFWLHGCCREWEGGPVNQVNHTSWVAVVTPTDRPKSVLNCCLIELFCSVVCVVTLPFWHFCWCRGFCHRTGSDLLLFVLQILTCCQYIGNGRTAIPYQLSYFLTPTTSVTRGLLCASRITVTDTNAIRIRSCGIRILALSITINPWSSDQFHAVRVFVYSVRK